MIYSKTKKTLASPYFLSPHSEPLHSRHPARRAMIGHITQSHSQLKLNNIIESFLLKVSCIPTGRGSIVHIVTLILELKVIMKWLSARLSLPEYDGFLN